MKELITVLQEASKAYYAEDREIMSNLEYDKLYDELVKLEEETGTVLAGSPTVNVGYEAVEELPKESHESPMLSLGKTKEREELKDWLKDKEGLLSWKLDGLTVVLTYENGKLSKAVTRGNGEIGEVVTNNAKTFLNLPLTIPYTGKLILRGEAIITYGDFKKINDEISEAAEKYKNPRNLCSGSVRQLNNKITQSRRVRFYVFSLVKAEEIFSPETQGERTNREFKSHEKEMEFLRALGFEVVEYKKVTSETIFLPFVQSVEAQMDQAAAFVVSFEGIALINNMNYCYALERYEDYQMGALTSPNEVAMIGMYFVQKYHHLFNFTIDMERIPGTPGQSVTIVGSSGVHFAYSKGTPDQAIFRSYIFTRK